MNKHTNPGFTIDEDDLPIGRILSRREILTLLGTTGTAALLAACAPDGQGAPGGPGGPGDGSHRPLPNFGRPGGTGATRQA